MSLAVTTDTVESGERRFQLLALSVRIATDCPILDRKLEYLVQDARQDYPMTDEIRLEAQRHADGYRICEAGREPRIEADSSMALGRLHMRSYARAYETLPSTGLFLHAACGSYEGRRFLLLGDSGAGKTTLITRLLSLGALGEGDELVLLEGDRMSALPRRFHIKSFGLDHFPWLAGDIHRLPSHDNGDGTFVYAFAPSDWGFSWHIRHAGIDAVFFLDPNHGGQSRILDMPRHRMMQLAVPQLRLIDRANRGWIAALCRQFDRAYCGRLVLGNLDSAADLLLSKLRELPTAG
jgi:hypothetical protein